MKLRIRRLPVIILAVLLLELAATAQVSQLAPFSADMHVTSSHSQGSSHEMTGKIYVSREHMRMDIQGEQRGGSVMITNFASQTTDMLMPEQHMYMEFNADQTPGRRAGMAPSIKPLRDPSNPCAYDETSTCNNLGVEQVNGRSCDHWQVTEKNGKISNIWIDQKLHFPIKTVSENSTWELTNVQEGQPAASLFEIPAGYQKMDLGGMMQGMRPPQQ